MHKCPGCGQDFEGNFCPNCGAEWQEEKSCPECGAKLSGSSRFCNNCGYSFNGTANAAASTKEKQPSQLKQKLSAVGGWIKSHLKIVVPVALGLVVLIILLSLIPTFIAMKTNGTYFSYRNGNFDEDDYFTLSGGKWTDNDGETGTYKIDGENIIFYVEFFGSTEELATGTISNGVIALDVGGGVKEIYAKKDHKHQLGEWKTVRYNCLSDGLQTRVCDCGFIEEQTLPAIGHHTYGDWVTVQAPCANDGLEKRTCVCGDYEERVIEATGEHVYSDWVVTKEPGYSVFGQKERHCTICNEKEIQQIDRLAKDFYEFVDLIKTKSFLCTILDAETRIRHDIDGNLIRYHLNDDRRGIYYETLNDKIYKYQYNNDDYMYHKTFSSQKEIDELNLIDLSDIIITDFNETEKYYTVILEDEIYKMVLTKKSLTLTAEERSITFNEIGLRPVELPSAAFIIDETV